MWDAVGFCAISVATCSPRRLIFLKVIGCKVKNSTLEELWKCRNPNLKGFILTFEGYFLWSVTNQILWTSAKASYVYPIVSINSSSVGDVSFRLVFAANAPADYQKRNKGNSQALYYTWSTNRRCSTRNRLYVEVNPQGETISILVLKSTWRKLDYNCLMDGL